MPKSFSDLMRASFSNSFMPTKSMLAMTARSSTITTATPLSMSIRTSLKRPVANSARSAAAPFSSL